MAQNSIPLPHKCPNCGKIAKTHQELLDKFGFRNMGDRMRSQSWCRECRKGN